LTRLSVQEATARLREATATFDFPAVRRAFWAHDGSFFEFDGAWFELRASGTDAVLRYYFEGPGKDAVHRLNSLLVAIQP
jgi:phosphomannomutase